MYKLQAMKGKALSVAVVAVFAVALATMGFATPAFANSKTNVLATAGDPQIDVDVPLSVVASVESGNEMTFPQPSYAKVENNSSFAVKVDTLKVTEAGGFELEALTGFTPAANKLAVEVSANNKDNVSLHNFVTAAKNPGANWVMNAASNNAIELGFTGKAFYDDFKDDTNQHKVFEMVWTFDAA